MMRPGSKWRWTCILIVGLVATYAVSILSDDESEKDEPNAGTISFPNPADNSSHKDPIRASWFNLPADALKKVLESLPPSPGGDTSAFFVAADSDSKPPADGKGSADG